MWKKQKQKVNLKVEKIVAQKGDFLKTKNKLKTYDRENYHC